MHPVIGGRPERAEPAIERIFDPCHRILRSQGAHIAVDSTPGEGTTFTLRFPLPEAAPEDPS